MIFLKLKEIKRLNESNDDPQNYQLTTVQFFLIEFEHIQNMNLVGFFLLILSM